MLMFSAGHINSPLHVQQQKSALEKSEWWKKRGRVRERRGRDGGHGVDKAVLFLIYVLL